MSTVQQQELTMLQMLAQDDDNDTTEMSPFISQMSQTKATIAGNI